MALQISALGPKPCEIVGSYGPFAYGIATAVGTVLTVTIPQFTICQGALILSSSTSTAGFCVTTSGNTFTGTVGSGEVCMYIAFGVPRA